MARTLSVAILCVVATILISAPAFAQFGGPFGGACGAPVAYGPPQDCIAQISCNVPVTTQVPVTTTTCVPQTVPICVPVQDVTTCVVPRAVVVPQTIPVPYVRPAMATTTVPVAVPVCSSVPVTSLVPQCYTVPMGGSCAAPIAGAVPPIAGGLDKGMAPNMGLGKGIGMGGIGMGGMSPYGGFGGMGGIGMGGISPYGGFGSMGLNTGLGYGGFGSMAAAK